MTIVRGAGALAAGSLVLAAGCVAAPAPDVEVRLDPSLTCEGLCAQWNAPVEPVRVHGDTYYVGVDFLAAILIASDEGHILLDGGFPQTAPLIAENIRTLGFRLADVRLIVNSHAHPDHVGGIAALAQASGATVAASPPSARAMEAGALMPDDPQYAGTPEAGGFPAVPDVQVVADGETLRVGDLAITAHFTPGHTPGGTTWTWRSCEEGSCLDVVYADSLSSVSGDDFRFTDEPGCVPEFRASMARVAALPCDILLAPHPTFIGMDDKLAARAAGADANPFIDPGACRAYAQNASASLDARIAAEEEAPGR